MKVSGFNRLLCDVAYLRRQHHAKSSQKFANFFSGTYRQKNIISVV